MGFNPSTHPLRECWLGQTKPIANETIVAPSQLYVELWVSLASLLRSYTAAHGLNGKLQATVELGEERIVVRHGDNWLDLERNGAHVKWSRENGSVGTMDFNEHGRLISEAGEEEMDMAAERWARELMMGERLQ